jgi:hypothetical protein
MSISSFYDRYQLFGKWPGAVLFALAMRQEWSGALSAIFLPFGTPALPFGARFLEIRATRDGMDDCKPWYLVYTNSTGRPVNISILLQAEH